jgi:hypothetical protein
VLEDRVEKPSRVLAGNDMSLHGVKPRGIDGEKRVGDDVWSQIVGVAPSGVAIAAPSRPTRPILSPRSRGPARSVNERGEHGIP